MHWINILRNKGYMEMNNRINIKNMDRRRRRIYGLAVVGCILAVVSLVVLVGMGVSAIHKQDGDKDTSQSSQPPQVLQGNDVITCSEFSSFSGQYVEDGSDIPVENVAAMLVTNNTEDFLDLATIEYEINGKPAAFVVTGLPAGKSAWVMENNQMTIESGADFKYIDKITAFKSEVVASTDKITLSADGNMLTAANNTDEKLEGVFVYYKTLHTDGNYFGGITYKTTFGDLEPGEKRTELAGHFDKDKTEIVRIGWKEK